LYVYRLLYLLFVFNWILLVEGHSYGLLYSGLGSDGWLGVLLEVNWWRFFLDALRQWWEALTRVRAMRSLRCFAVAE
jgi:hypothetical protein